VKLPAMPAGGPYKLLIGSVNDTITFSDVLIGEVWVASGQSNMARMLRQSEYYKHIKSVLERPEIRLFKMGQNVHLSSKAYTEKELQRVTAGAFYQPASWTRSSAASAPDFSAVACFFARNLQDSLKVPVGIIQNAIGSSPTKIVLQEGWNKVLLKVPHGRKAWKWMFTFVPVEKNNGMVRTVKNLKFSAQR